MITQIPYKSQYDADANQYRNDCGPACVAMILNGLGKEVTTNTVYRRSGADANGYVSVSQMMRAAQTYKITFEYFYPWTLDELMLAVKAGTAPIVLVHYGAWSSLGKTQNRFTGPHFVVVVGYDKNYIYVNDPLWKGSRRYEGERFAWTHKEFLAAWSTASKDGNRNYSGIYCKHAIPVDEFGDGGEPQLQPAEDEETVEPAPVPVVETYQVAPELKRRITAWAEYFEVPLNELSSKAVVAAYQDAMGDWGENVTLHEVTPEDTLPLIALKYYDRPDKWEVLVYFNGMALSDGIHDGDILQIPEPLEEPIEIPAVRLPLGKILPFYEIRTDGLNVMLPM
ncbi:C39 family peptidase [bacterium]|nr:C39 family peptidase [bacterium]